MSDTFVKEVEEEILRARSDLGQRRITFFLRLLWLIAIGAMITIGLALNNVALPWLFGVAVVCSLVWLSHVVILNSTKQ